MSFVRTLPLALLLATPLFAQEKHLLRFKFVPGTVVHYSTNQEMNMSMNMGAQDMSTKVSMQMFATTKVKDVKDKVADIEQEITRVKAVMNNPMMNVNFDSDDEDSDPGMLEGIAEVVGTKVMAKLSDAGKVEKFETTAESEDEGGVDMQQMLSQMVVALPEGPVAIGETWSNKVTMPMAQLGETEVEVVNKLVSVSDTHFVIDQELKIDTENLEVPGDMEVKVSEAKGQTKIDLRTGMPSEMTMNMKMKMTGQMTMTMDVKMSITPAEAPKAKKDGEKKEEGK